MILYAKNCEQDQTKRVGARRCVSIGMDCILHDQSTVGKSLSSGATADQPAHAKAPHVQAWSSSQFRTTKDFRGLKFLGPRVLGKTVVALVLMTLFVSQGALLSGMSSEALLEHCLSALT